MANHLILLISGILSGSLVTYFVMRYRASVYQESAEKQFSRYKKEAVLMKGNIAEKEDLEKMNERLKDEFRNLINEILEAKNQKKN